MRLNAGEIIGVVNAGEGLRAELELKRIHSFLLVPGIGKSGLRCVLWTHNGEHAFEFHASAQRFLRSLVSQATVTLENSALMQELQQNNAQLSAANRKLAELDRLKSQFLSVATHELRTPLTILLGYNSMLAESLADRLSSEERDTLEESIAACKRLIRLVNSMLDLSQIQTGKMPLEIRDIDLRSLVSSVLTLFHHEAKARDISLSSALPARLPRLAADPERLQQVLINLLGNAMKFTRAGGAIKVQARHLSAEDAIEISVSDTGVGISKEDQEHIFDEFSHPHHQAIDGSGDGAGLGLSIVRRVVEAHGGEIRLRSQPGKGSTFSVRLPLGRGSHIAVSA
jgi:signal transduction histidine kinase